jgi:hypothetical protein
MTITLIILSVVFSVISGISKAICDLSEEGKIKFYKKTFWIKDLSWQNKWKNGDKSQGEKFFGSSRWFVAQTDAWHLFGVLFRTTFANTYICVGLLISINIWYAFASLVVYIIFATTFHIFYTYKIFRK